ncbi:hypothetical protein [Streptosporangium subroseum]|uniref:hypothetical protein n=1 Tax=Streptosporangium subroseum TaxID=106412 RepID=UPI00308DC7FC|nr:hypothetical protein OHB15_14855 [Streptosporangium subroseum]
MQSSQRRENTQVLLGVQMDGGDLDEQGPHLVVPGDRSGGRHISRIVELRTRADACPWRVTGQQPQGQAESAGSGGSSQYRAMNGSAQEG